MTPPIPAEPLTVSEAARRLRLSDASVYALCAARKIRHRRVGVGRGKIQIPADAIEEYLATATVGTAESYAAPTVPPVTTPPPRPRHLRMKPP